MAWVKLIQLLQILLDVISGIAYCNFNFVLTVTTANLYQGSHWKLTQDSKLHVHLVQRKRAFLKRPICFLYLMYVSQNGKPGSEMNLG